MIRPQVRLHTIKKANFRPTKNQFLLVMVRVVGLEPTRYAAQEPKGHVTSVTESKTILFPGIATCIFIFYYKAFGTPQYTI